MKWFIMIFCVLASGIAALEKSAARQVLYLAGAGMVSDAIERYEASAKLDGAEDYRVLGELALRVLETGAESDDPEVRVMSLYGAKLSQSPVSIDVFETVMKGNDPGAQLIAIQTLGLLDDDRCEEILMEAFNSPYPVMHVEAAYQLALRKSKKALGIIESLSSKFPPQMMMLFSRLYGVLGTKAAVNKLGRLSQHRSTGVRVSAISALGMLRSEEMLPSIRSIITHSDTAELEAALAALGSLKDSREIERMEKLTSHGDPAVKLGALCALYQCGKQDVALEIEAMAKGGSVFAIDALGKFEEGKQTLIALLKSQDSQVRLNASLALLKMKDVRCLPEVEKILLSDEADLGYLPVSSLSGTQRAWKIIPSKAAYAKKLQIDVYSSTSYFKGVVLQAALELPEMAFIKLAHAILGRSEHGLVPITVRLLENLHSERAQEMLLAGSRKAGSPFIRTYCHLGAMRMKLPGDHEAFVKAYLKEHQDRDLVSFRSVKPWAERELLPQMELTPEEHAHLLVEIYEFYADQHTAAGIKVLLEGLKGTNTKNRYFIAGLLLKAIQ